MNTGERTVDASERLMTPGEVAALFRVDARTVTKWGSANRLPSLKTPGGRLRFRRADVERLLRANTVEMHREASR